MRRVAGCSVRRTTRGVGHVGVVEDVGDVEHFRKHLDAVVDGGEAGDERRDPPADVFTRSVIRIAFAARQRRSDLKTLRSTARWVGWTCRC